MKKINFWGELTDISVKKEALSTARTSSSYFPRCEPLAKWADVRMFWTRTCLFFSRSIDQVTPKVVYFHYLKKAFSGSKYPKNNFFNFENRSTGSGSCGSSHPLVPRYEAVHSKLPYAGRHKRNVPVVFYDLARSSGLEQVCLYSGRLCSGILTSVVILSEVFFKIK